MRKLFDSIKKRPINLCMIIFTALFYLLNNAVFKFMTYGSLQLYFVCYFNDMICPLLFLPYVNILLLTRGREMCKLHHMLLLCFASGIIWEVLAPVLKPSAKADVWDMFFYLLGGSIYWGIYKLTVKRITKSWRCRK